MNFVRNLIAEPWRFDYFALLRQLERTFKDGPRIGDSAALREEFARFGQDPFMEFPASNVARVKQDGDNAPLKIFVRHLGLLGPQGALPLAATEEAYHYVLAGDDAFPRFLDLLNGRFLQLFFRAWADARPIAQHDRPADDRFIAYVGSFAGLGSDVFADRDTVPDMAKLSFAGLISPRAKCASRLTRFLQGLFDVKVEIDEFVGTWLSFDPSHCSRLGGTHARLGRDALLGSRVFSVEDKIRVRVFVKNFTQYEQFLPTEARNLSEPLADAVFFYIGDELEWEVELAIPAGEVVPVRLGQSGRLGWTTWVSPNWTSTEEYRRDARFQLSERLSARRAAAADASAI